MSLLGMVNALSVGLIGSLQKGETVMNKQFQFLHDSCPTILSDFKKEWIYICEVKLGIRE